jgi:hypothetical protein
LSRNYVAPPDAAPATNIAPGREWKLVPPEEYEHASDPPIARVVDAGRPNMTRYSIAEQLFVRHLDSGIERSTARALADATALQMVP